MGARAFLPGQVLVSQAAGLAPNERMNRQDWEATKAAIRNAITGAGMSNEERERLDAMIEGAKTPAEQANSIARVHAAVQRRIDTIRAGASDEARGEYDRRLREGK
jgi:hypothetical protein